MQIEQEIKELDRGLKRLNSHVVTLEANIEKLRKLARELSRARNETLLEIDQLGEYITESVPLVRAYFRLVDKDGDTLEYEAEDFLGKWPVHILCSLGRFRRRLALWTAIHDVHGLPSGMSTRDATRRLEGQIEVDELINTK